jgi:hypothetical protein
MPKNLRPKAVETESHMSQAVLCTLGKYAAREIRAGGCIFDVVAYSKNERLFKLIECKRSSRTSPIGHAFGHLAAYSATLAEHGIPFLDAFSKKLTAPMRLGEWTKATDNYRRFKVGCYVALTVAIAGGS